MIKYISIHSLQITRHYKLKKKTWEQKKKTLEPKRIVRTGLFFFQDRYWSNTLLFKTGTGSELLYHLGPGPWAYITRNTGKEWSPLVDQNVNG